MAKKKIVRISGTAFPVGNWHRLFRRSAPKQGTVTEKPKIAAKKKK